MIIKWYFIKNKKLLLKFFNIILFNIIFLIKLKNKVKLKNNVEELKV